MALKILVGYASQYGSTREVADVIGETLRDAGKITEVLPVDQITDLQHYDAVIIGSAIQYDRWMPAARAFIRRNQPSLSKLPVAYFFTCLTLSTQNDKTAQQALAYANNIRALQPEIKPVSVGCFAGVLNFRNMSWLRRLIFKALSIVVGVKEGDYRDWQAIRGWAEDVHAKLGIGATEKIS